MHSWNGSPIDVYLATQFFFVTKSICEMARLRGRPRQQLNPAAKTQKPRRSEVKLRPSQAANSQKHRRSEGQRSDGLQAIIMVV